MFGLKNKKKTLENVEHFPVDIKIGLINEQIDQRRDEGLINKTKKHVTKSYLRIVYENVVNFFNILLFGIAALMIVARIPINYFFFLLILGANICIGLYQDIRARKLIDKLKVISSPKVNVLRNGMIQSIPANQLVLDDIIQIKSGSQIVCDGSIVDGFIELNESLLTGEPINISKTVGDLIYSGSFAASGTALYRVESLGKENYAEKLQSKARKFKKAKSEILVYLKRIFRVIGIFVVLFAIAFGFIYRESFTDIHSVEFQDAAKSISGSLVAMIPIGMYLLTSITLAVGVIRLVKRNMLTQDMYCIEMLARVDTLCLDKTGTLTDGNLNVKEVISLSDTSERDLAKIVMTLIDATKDDNATARAIRRKFDSLNRFDSYSAIPFSSERKFSAVMLEDGRSIVMGAREFIPHNNPEADKKCKEYEKMGLRVLILGEQRHVITPQDPLGESEIIGFVVLEDHIRDDAPQNIQWFKDNGVSIRIITGDNPESAAEIARRAGIEGCGKFISLEGMPIEEVRHIANDYVIFGRVTPEQKEVLIEAMKDEGHTVAMTGDGVNDILALRVADCSIAMASGSDAAKNVSHLVSMDSNFSSLPDVVREGRRVINNLQRAVSIFLVKTAFAMFATAFFIIWGLVDKTITYPFDTPHMLIWEILFIGVGSLFLSLQPNEEQIKSKFIVNILVRVVPAALVQTLMVIFYFLLFMINPSYVSFELARTFSVLSFTIFSFIILVRVCLPFDIYRFFLVIGLGFVAAVGMLADYLALGDNSFLGIQYSALQGDQVWILAVVIIVAVGAYIGLEVLAAKLHKWIDNRKEAQKYDHF